MQLHFKFDFMSLVYSESMFYILLSVCKYHEHEFKRADIIYVV